MSPKHIFNDKGKNKAQQKSQKQKKDKQQQKGVDAPKSPPVSGHLDAEAVTHLQQTAGNTAVQRLLAQREGDGPTALDDNTAAEIRRQKGDGQKIDADVADQAGKTLGQDVSDATVHTDQDADKLSRKLGAKAFTTGKDIFFREGEYEPGSKDGQRLLGHELTHVAQQKQGVPGIQSKGAMTVNDPNDQYEAEADRVADSIANQSQQGTPDAQRQAAPEEEELAQMQQAPEEEDLAQTQAAPEEEELAQMQAAPEEEELAQMQPEEEELAQMQEAPEEEDMVSG